MRPARGALGAFLFLIVACGGDAGPDSGGAAGPSTPTPDRPVLLVTIDTLRWDALGSYGAATPTPVLDELAASGVRFEYAVAHAVVTLPSHASILTGLDPSRHGVHDNDGYRVADAIPTWAERMGAAGYETGAFVGAFPLDSMFGLAQGFDVYDDAYAGEQSAFSVRMVERPANEVVDSALSWIDDTGGPWFAWVHVYDPHAPYEAPGGFAERYPDNPYVGEVAWVDSALRPLIEEARARDAIVIVTSDHGEAFGDHGEETHGVFAYAATLRVPLIMSGLPDVEPGTVVRGLTRHVDVLPTAFAAVGIEAPEVQGRSLYPAMRDGVVEPETTSYFEALTPYLDWGWAPLRGLYEDDLKYIDLPIVELYDVTSDPRETTNLAAARATDLRRLAGLLDEHLEDAVADGAAAVTEDAATLERLRALGYVGSSGVGPDADEVFGPADDPKRLIVEGSLMQDAVRAMEAGELETAVGLLNQVIESRPNLWRAYQMLANARSLQRGPEAAVEVLERAAATGEASSNLLSRLGQYYLEAGRPAAAAGVIEAVVEARPDDVEMLSLLASIYGELGRVPDAEAAIRRGLALDPTFARLHANRGTLMLQTGRPDEAAAAFRTALDYDESIADASNGLGVIAAQQGDLRSAVEHWQRALRYAPDQPRVLFNLGFALAQMGRTREAVDRLERYLELEPRDQDAARLLAELRAQAGIR